ncbi:uncharacterized protein LOC133818547 [Humulus lupulus]|uniref:uncharacterized protein LOC133818547 n=1 Tax=Humulus lupulus TaxID=3486 RepID=UPI002B404CD5|nr:uncharacterized protein LOC133818547 [Humulus lupulus]
MNQLINCEVKIKGVNQKAYLSFVYGRNSVEERKSLWSQLYLPQATIKPWLVVGDFNAIFEFDDRIGGRLVTELEVEDSRLWRAKALLTELWSSGSFFTWSKKQKEGSRIFSKLNRVFINEQWLDTFPELEAHINWDTISDHCYCIIKTVQFQVSGIRPFIYYNMWANHKDFRSTVLNNWSKPTGGYGLQQTIQKLRRLKPVLNQLNRKQVGDVVQQYAAAKQKYEMAQFLLQQSPSSSMLQQDEIEAATEYARMSKFYESFLRQKRKINWLRFGDENTAYFHASLKQRRMRNRITSFMNEESQIVESYPEPFTKKDVKRSLFSIPSIKSPSPDGFGSGFYKALWKDIGEEISEAILMFFEHGVIPSELNGTILSLIPKILPMIIHQNQGAFIKNRQVAHNILILQDLLHGYTRKNISPQCLIKIDLSKAYDFVDWVFMEDILTAFCFPRRFIQWIMTCLTGTSYTLMLNGRLQGSFEGRKGLRQGDPISPLLFVLVMEYLTRLLKQASHHREFRFHPMCKHLQLVNLCFADDLILFCKGNFRSVQILFEGFSKFFHCSGLAANLGKSQIFFGGVAAEVKNIILRSVALGEGSFPLKYLGVSLRPMRCVIQEIDRLCRNFLWRSKNNRYKFHCPSWSQVCLPKVLGGLGFKEGSNWNKVLLAKYIWALSSKKDVLWVKWIDEMYLKGHSFWSYQLKPDVSWYWQGPDVAKAMWCSLSIPKHRFMLWQSVLGHLLTRDNLIHCQIDVSSQLCPVWELLKNWLGPGIWPNQFENWTKWLEGKPKNLMHRISVASLATAALTEFVPCAAIFARTGKSMTLGGQYEKPSSLSPGEKDYRQVVNDVTMLACEKMESIGAPDLRTAFQAKRPRVTKKATPKTGDTTKSPSKGKDVSSAGEQALVTTVIVWKVPPPPPRHMPPHLQSVLAQYRRIAHGKARNKEIQAELAAAKVALNVVHESENAAKAALTVA